LTATADKYRATVLDWADSDGVRVAVYLVATAVALVAWAREYHRARTTPSLWPTFWLLTAAVFLAMAVGRAVDLGGLATELGRSEARAQGWYADRRRIQAIVIGLLGATWLVVVAVSLLRVPARRRRYLPAALAVFTLMCFVGVRLISLHQVDGLLYRRDIAGAQVGALAELFLLAVAVALVAWPPPIGRTVDYVRPAPVR
jgi:hypothetical protein